MVLVVSQCGSGMTGVKPGMTGVKPGMTRMKPGMTGVRPEMAGGERVLRHPLLRGNEGCMDIRA